MEERYPAPTLDELIARVYRYYPRGIHPDEPAHRSSEESRRLEYLVEAAAMACRQGVVTLQDGTHAPIDDDVRPILASLCSWQPFVARCQREFPDRVVWDESGPFFDPGYRVSVARDGYISPPRFSEPGEEEAPAAAPQRLSTVPQDPVLCMVSIFAPVYAVFTWAPRTTIASQTRYSNFPDRYADRIDALCTMAEDTFGFHRLSEDMLRAPVRDVLPFSSNRDMQDTILADCLFTELE